MEYPSWKPTDWTIERSTNLPTNPQTDPQIDHFLTNVLDDEYFIARGKAYMVHHVKNGALVYDWKQLGV